ncbi:MAG TPA: FAD-dependent oxidoreductase [Planctomycetes bacterium]|nr:FAD-dependent oxidoreductase [Planctomycetota bacterium]HIJ69817.1 FAD-dependent oxidoreductase [Planctomycetota bacterium]
MRKIVVIGGSAAGMTAAITAARQDPDARVTVVTQDRQPYRRPAVPALIAGYITRPADVKIFPSETLARYNITLICPAEATEIDTANKKIYIRSEGKEKKLSYDTAVITTGGYPIIPRIPGSDKKGVCTFTTYEAAAQIVEAARGGKSAVVIGAGFIALEIAEALMRKGLDVYFNVRSRILRKLVEPDVSGLLINSFEKRGLRMLAGEAISKIGGQDRVEYVVHKSKKIATNLVVMGTGVRANTALAEKSGIKLGRSGAIKVDNRMQTSIPDIYAAGDCAESPDRGTGKFVYLPVGSIGASAGKIAGTNAAGGDKQTIGFLRAQADEILGMQIFSIGHSSTSAKQVNLEVNLHNLTVPVESRLTKPFETAKMLTNSNDEIVGAQLVAKKHGSQFAWQMYQAVSEGADRKEFLSRFNSPRLRMAEAFANIAELPILVENTGEGKALTLGDATSRKNIKLVK